MYFENIVTTILVTISSFVRSVAVTSMKIFLVLVEILEWVELIMGGIEHTVRFESRISGYTGESFIICK